MLPPLPGAVFSNVSSNRSAISLNNLRASSTRLFSLPKPKTDGRPPRSTVRSVRFGISKTGARVRRFDLLDGVSVLAVLLNTVTHNRETVDVTVRRFERGQLLRLEAVGVEFLGNNRDNDVAGRDEALSVRTFRRRRVDDDVVIVSLSSASRVIQSLSALWRFQQRLDILVVRKLLARGERMSNSSCSTMMLFTDSI